MTPKLVLFATLTLALVAAFAQDEPVLTRRVSPAHEAEPADTQPAAAVQPPAPDTSNRFIVPAGTKIPLTLKQGITTKNARIGDPVYAQTVFPIVQNDSIVIPSGTFVQGVVRSIVRPGRVKGRAQLQMSFNSMIFPNGYTIILPGAVDSMPGSQNTDVKGTEGTIQQGGSKAKDAETIAKTTMPGAGIGAIAGGGKGAGIGAAAGGAVGLATVLLTRGPDIQLDPGSSVEMILERNIVLDHVKLNKQ
jgi:type IV secretion system protein VirB10